MNVMYPLSDDADTIGAGIGQPISSASFLVMRVSLRSWMS